MTCPHCNAETDPQTGACPRCGTRLLRQVTAVMKLSAVWIAADDQAKFYGSLGEVPDKLRERLVESTNSVNSGTIVIADRRGRDRLIANSRAQRASSYGRAPHFPRSSRRASAAPEPELPEVTVPPEEPEKANSQWVAWVGLGLVLASAAVIAAAFGMHW